MKYNLYKKSSRQIDFKAGYQNVLIEKHSLLQNFGKENYSTVPYKYSKFIESAVAGSFSPFLADNTKLSNTLQDKFYIQ